MRDVRGLAADLAPRAGASGSVETRSMSGVRGKSRATRQLIEACHEILAEIQPATVRAVCYRLFTLGLIPDMSKGSTNKVSAQLVYARERGLIPWQWIVDETREAECVNTWSNPDAIIDAAVRGYRRDYWQAQQVRVEVWSEKGTVRGTLKPVLDEYGITFRVMRGFASATVINDIAVASAQSAKPLIALYVGDYDPSGLYMSDADLPGRISRYGGEVDLRRVALVADDLAGLPSFSAHTKTGDARFRWFVERYGAECWELDAMPPPTLRAAVAAAICAHVDADAWQHATAIEAAEVASMQAFHAAWSSRLQA
jgi:hypothetical protein